MAKSKKALRPRESAPIDRIDRIMQRRKNATKTGQDEKFDDDFVASTRKKLRINDLY